MQRLVEISDSLAIDYDVHTTLLEQAQNITNEILDKLEDTAASAAAMGDIFLGSNSLKSWWPYVWCPAVSLVVGSYGLAPSMLRHLGLLALGKVFVLFDGSFLTSDPIGEITGLVISRFPSFTSDFIPTPAANLSAPFSPFIRTTGTN